MDYTEYYTQLGRLLYAIAKVDGRVQKKEVEELKRIVKEELVKLEDSTDPLTPTAPILRNLNSRSCRTATSVQRKPINLFWNSLTSTPPCRPK